jgi:hypothetical protein
VRGGGKTNLGRETIVYEKQIGDVLYSVEEVRTGRRELAMQTMYKRPGKGGAG